jgi:hypothetical protein
MIPMSLRTATFVVLVSVGAATADAADAQRIAGMMADAAAATGQLTFTFDKATATGDDVTLTGVKLTVGETESIVVPTLTLIGTAERPGGGFTARRAVLDGGSAKSRFGDSAWATAAADEVVVPAAAEVTAHAKVRPFAALGIGGLTVVGPKAQEIKVASVAVAVGPVTDGGPPSKVTVAATGARVPGGVVTNPIGSAMLTGMGFSEFTANVALDSDYDTTANRIVIRTLTIDTAEVGRIAVSAELSDTSLGSLLDAKEAADARAAARLDSGSMRFEDAGLIKRMLDMQAGMLGGTREEARDALVYGLLPLMLNYVDNEAFRDQFMAAAEVFLKEPKSITFTAAPAMPVPLGVLMRTALRSPLKLPALLTPSVTANK